MHIIDIYRSNQYRRLASCEQGCPSKSAIKGEPTPLLGCSALRRFFGAQPAVPVEVPCCTSGGSPQQISSGSRMSPTGWGLKTGPPVSDESLVVHHRWIRRHFRARYPNPIAIRLKNWLLSKDQNSLCRSRYKTAAVGGIGRPTLARVHLAEG